MQRYARNTPCIDMIYLAVTERHIHDQQGISMIFPCSEL